GASEGERQFLGVRQIAAMVKSLREEYGFPVFLNADHTHSLASAMEAAKAGFDWIVFDVSTLPLEENMRHRQRFRDPRPTQELGGREGDWGREPTCKPPIGCASRTHVGSSLLMTSHRPGPSARSRLNAALTSARCVKA